MPCPDLPVEILEQILEFLREERQTLKNCSLVSRAWAAISQAILFRTFKLILWDKYARARPIDASTKCQEFLAIFRRNYTHFSRTERLYLSCEPGANDIPYGRKEPLVADVLSHFTQLKSLSLTLQSWSGCGRGLRNAVWGLLKLPSLETLDVTFPNQWAREDEDCLSSILNHTSSSLQHLSWWDKSSVGPPPSAKKPAQPCTTASLQTLTLRLNRVGRFLDWINSPRSLVGVENLRCLELLLPGGEDLPDELTQLRGFLDYAKQAIEELTLRFSMHMTVPNNLLHSILSYGHLTYLHLKITDVHDVAGIPGGDDPAGFISSLFWHQGRATRLEHIVLDVLFLRNPTDHESKLQQLLLNGRWLRIDHVLKLPEKYPALRNVEFIMRVPSGRISKNFLNGLQSLGMFIFPGMSKANILEISLTQERFDDIY